MGLGAAAGSLLAAAIAFPAFAADPYPDQPGVLGAGEFRAARAALAASSGSDAKLPLTASGKRSAGGPFSAYAVFAAPAQHPSVMLTTQRRIVCNALGSSAQWKCLQQTLYSYAMRDQTQVFAYQAQNVAEDPVLPNRVVTYFNHCFPRQFQAMRGEPYGGGVPALAEVVHAGERVTVTAGPIEAPDAFELAEAPAGTLAAKMCEFDLQRARLAKSGTTLTEADAQARRAALEEEQQQRLVAEARRREAQAAPTPVPPPISSFRRRMDELTDFSVGLNALCALLALVLPLVALSGGRRAAAMTSVALGGATFVFALAVAVFLKLASIPDTGNCMLLVIPATVLAGLSMLVWVIVLAAAPKPKHP